MIVQNTIGELVQVLGVDPPENFFLCNGNGDNLRDSYPDLCLFLGDRYSGAINIDCFAVPDLGNYLPLGSMCIRHTLDS